MKYEETKKTKSSELYTTYFVFQKGAALFLSVLIIVVLLAVSLGVSTILVSQVVQFRGQEHSVQAFFAADTGIERALFEEKNVSGTLGNGASYSVQRFYRGPDCRAENYCLKSQGTFQETRRAIEITR